MRPLGKTLLSATAVFGAAACGAPAPVDLTKVTTAQWRGDLRYMGRELAAHHKSPFHRISQERYERIVADIDAAIPNLPASEVPVYLEKLTASSDASPMATGSTNTVNAAARR